MKSCLIFTVSILLVLTIGVGFAKDLPESLEVDLAKGKHTTVPISVYENLRIRVVSLVPDFRENYRVIVQITLTQPEPFELSKFMEKVKKEQQEQSTKRTFTGGKPCSLLNKAIGDLAKVKKEEKVPELIDALQKALDKNPKTSGCTDLTIKYGIDLISKTVYDIPGKFSLKSGEQLEVTITRNTSEGEDEAPVWKFVYTTGSRGEWLVSYGFSFIPGLFSREYEYFTEDSSSVFVIKRGENTNWLSFAPSVFFTWMPRKYALKDWSPNLTAGLGFDLSNPVVFLGFSLTYNHNVSLVTGLVAHKQKKLLARYDEGDIVNENLNSEQLHNDRYRFNPFIALSFRFSSNPFSKEEKKEEQKKEEGSTQEKK